MLDESQYQRTMLPLEEQQPFMYGIPQNKQDEVSQEEVKSLRQWYKEQPNYPKWTDNHFRLFLHSCFGNQIKTQKTIEDYVKIRSKHSELFSNRRASDSDVKRILDIGELVMCPTETSKGYRILVYRLKDYDFSKLNFLDGVKTFLLVNDIFLSESPLSSGYIVIFDMAGVCFGHMTKVSFGPLRVFMKYIQDCHPARLKAIHVINTVSFIDKILCLLKPLLKNEIFNMVHFHGAITALTKTIPLELFPEDYGGNAPKMSTLHAQTREWCEDKYKSWLEEEEKLRFCTNNNNDKPGTTEIDCSFKKLTLD